MSVDMSVVYIHGSDRTHPWCVINQGGVVSSVHNGLPYMLVHSCTGQWALGARLQFAHIPGVMINQRGVVFSCSTTGCSKRPTYVSIGWLATSQSFSTHVTPLVGVLTVSRLGTSNSEYQRPGLGFRAEWAPLPPLI